MPRTVGGTPVRVFGGVFTAPLGYLISGIGAASFLLYGLLDLAWHSIYGFDAVLNTPSHVALFLSITITMIGSVIVFAAARDGRTPQPPELPAAMPMFLIVAATLVEVLLHVTRRRELDAKRVLLLAGTVTGLVVAIGLPLQQGLTDPTAHVSGTDLALVAIL